ncbi:NAD-dependent epimerase/dehydratase family protein [Streptomyces sp. NPDC047928]|uniref:NAD-dependent epimerase/dehydratase family protein n=1 Tax=unclassified Streptomyces TaxID=2593676 RepID=UPI003717F26D
MSVAPPAPGVLITGASGFIGGHVAAEARRVSTERLALLSHRTAVALPYGNGDVGDGRSGRDDRPGRDDRTGLDDRTGRDDRTGGGSGGCGDRREVLRSADLSAPASLRGVCEGVHTLVHCASLIGDRAEDCDAVNDRGTRALVQEAVRCGVRRIVYVSTAAVHGRGAFRGASGDRPPPVAPVSAVSRSRAAAERHVLDAGGTVLRPHLVYGAGDRWVVPSLAALDRLLGARLTGITAAQSLVDVADLARAVVAAALTPRPLAAVYYVGHPEPVDGTRLMDAVREVLGRAPHAATTGLGAVRARLAGQPRVLEHVERLAADHWFADDRIWGELDCPPGPGFAARLPRYADWYREFLNVRHTG